ncbi:MAG: TetR family transcriptional regulator [Steroidobacteraceae bacterium]
MAILNAALRRFALSSYDEVSLRQIASDAGIDVALVGRYFESKDKLFAIVMNELLNPQDLFFGDRATFGKRQAEAALCAEMDPNFGLAPILAIIRSVTSPTARPLLQKVSQERFTRPLAEWLGGTDAEVRAHLIAGLLSGSIVNRYIAAQELHQPVTKARYIARLAEALQALVDD